MRSINQRYKLQSQLGVGGMGKVFLAMDRLSGEQIALKQVNFSTKTRSQLSDGNNQLRLALAHEFQTLATLRHPHIISVLDYGFDDQRQPFYTMRYLEGAQTLLDAGNTSSLHAKINLIKQTVEALAYLHRRGVLHRDIKPENVLVVDGHAHVLDFGLAVNGGHLTATSGGSFSYMAPELWYEEAYALTSDLWAVGVMFFQLLAGQHPFSPMDSFLMDRVLEDEPNWGLLPAISPSITAILKKLLQKKPKNRYQRATHLLRDLSFLFNDGVVTESAEIRESYLQAATFVGRVPEIDALQIALERAKKDGGSLWLIGGESGVGKSRLLNELRPFALVEGWQVVRGQAVAGDDTGYKLWRDVLPLLVLNIEINDTEAGVLKAIVPNIEQIIGRKVPKPVDLDSEASRQRLVYTIVEMVRRQNRPTLLLLEDLQWSDISLEPLRRLARTLEKYQIVIVASYRDDERPDLPNEIPFSTLLPLDRLDHEAMVTLSQSMLGKKIGSQENILRLLQQETEGNAFFAVEVVRALAEEAGRLGQVGQLTLPDTIFTGGMQHIVRHRLSKIPAAYQPILRLAAVAGRSIDRQLMKTIASVDDVKWLSACHDAAIVTVQEDRWFFAHDKLREGLLNALTHEENRLAHQQIAQAIEQIYPDDASQSARLVAFWRVVGNRLKEHHHANLAGDYAVKQFTLHNALPFYRRALELTPTPADRFFTLRSLEDVYFKLGQRDDQRTILKQLAEVAETLNTGAVATARYRQTRLAYTRSEQSIFELARLTIESAEKCGSNEIAIKTYHLWAQALGKQGEVAAAKTKMHQALKLSHLIDDKKLEATTFRELGLLLNDNDDYSQVKANLLKSAELFQQIGDSFGEAVSLFEFSRLARRAGDVKQGKEALETSLPIIRQASDIDLERKAVMLLGIIAMEAGKLSEAGAYYLIAQELAENLEDRTGLARAYNLLGVLADRYNQYEKSLAYFQKVLAIYEEIGKWGFRTGIYINIAGAYDGLGDVEGKKAAFYKALEVGVKVGDLYGEALALASLGRLHWETKEYALAEQNFLRALEINQRVGNVLRSGSLACLLDLSRVSLEQGKREQASTYIDEVLKIQTENPYLKGSNMSTSYLLQTLEVLEGLGDPRLFEILPVANELATAHLNELNQADGSPIVSWVTKDAKKIVEFFKTA